MLIFGCKESKVGQGNPTKDSMSIDTDSVISGKVFTKQDIASEDTLNAVIRTQSPKSKDFDFEVFIMRGEKTVQIIPFSYPKDDTFDPNGGRKDSCLMADVTFDGNKDLLVYLGQFGNQGVEYWPVRERPFWGVSHRVEPLSRLHLSPFKGIYFFILKFCFMLNNSS